MGRTTASESLAERHFAEEGVEVAEGIGIGVAGGVVAFEVLDDPVDATSE